jgi:TonB family protein
LAVIAKEGIMCKRFFLVVAAGILGNCAFAQEFSKSEAPAVIVDRTAAFPGGTDSMMRYFSLNLRYPSVAMEHKVEGEVMVGFEIDEQGSIHNALIINGIDSYCDEEALRVVNRMPRWNPALQKGKAVKVMYRLPIYFQLPGKQDEHEQQNNQ